EIIRRWGERLGRRPAKTSRMRRAQTIGRQIDVRPCGAAWTPPATCRLCYCAAPVIFALDLEGVLAPEIWPVLGRRFDLPDLLLTPRDLGDFSELMHRRVAAARQRGLTLRDLQAVAHAVEPYLGAREFLSRLRALGQVVVISDTFHEFSEPLLQK